MNLGRNGHFTDLTIEQWLAKEDPSSECDLHFKSCQGCRTAVEEIEKSQVRIPPFVGIQLDKGVEKNDYSRIKLVLFVGLATTLGLVLALKLTVEKPKDEIRIKGRSFTTFLYGKTGDSVRPLFNESVVHSGERIGFRVENKKKGFLAIVGVDDSGESYLCFPQDSSTAALIDPGEERTLKDAIRLDSKLGKEHIVSVFCDTPFSIEQLKSKINETPLTDRMFPSLFENCEQSEVILEKK